MGEPSDKILKPIPDADQGEIIIPVENDTEQQEQTGLDKAVPDNVLEFKTAQAKAQADQQAADVRADIAQTPELPADHWLNQYTDPYLQQRALEKYSRLTTQMQNLQQQLDSQGFVGRLWNRATGTRQALESQLAQMNQALTEILEGRFELLLRAEQNGQAKIHKEEGLQIESNGDVIHLHGEDACIVNEEHGSAVVIDGISTAEKKNLKALTIEITRRFNSAMQELPDTLTAEQAVDELEKQLPALLGEINLDAEGGMMILATKYLPEHGVLVIMDIGNCQLALQKGDEFSDIKLNRDDSGAAFQANFDRNNKKMQINDNRPRYTKTPYVYAISLAEYRTDQNQAITLFLGSDGLSETRFKKKSLESEFLNTEIQKINNDLYGEKGFYTYYIPTTAKEIANATPENIAKLERDQESNKRKAAKLEQRLSLYKQDLARAEKVISIFGDNINLSDCAPALMENGLSTINELSNDVDDVSVVRMDIPPRS